MKILLLSLLMLTSTGTFAGLSKWVDADGRVHYSDTPPPSNVEVIKLRSSRKSVESSNPDDSGNPDKLNDSAPSAPKTIAEREAELKKVQQEKQAAAEKSAEEKKHADALKASCDAAKQNLRTLEEGIRIVEIDARGEQSYMDDERRKEKIAEAQQNISQACK